MRNYLKLIYLFLLSSFLIIESFAIEAPNNFKLDSIKENSVDLSWDKVEGAFMYYIQYDKKSGLSDGYELETDFIESMSGTISNLEYGNTYYLSVIALNDKGEESNFSEELVIDLIDKNDQDFDFILKGVNTISKNKLELTFSHLLNESTDTIREFKIRNKKDDLDIYNVTSNELNINDKSKLFITFDKDLIVGDEYELLVLGIISAEGDNIESGIDNIETFIFIEQIVPDENNEATGSIVSQEIIDSNEYPISELNSAGPNGSNLTSDQVENTTLVLAKNNKDLPQTGPEHILLIIFSILIGSILFVSKYKKV